MPVVNVLGSFADPLNQDQGAAKLVNCRIVVRKPDEQKPALVRLVGSPGLAQVSKPSEHSPVIAICTAVNTVWTAHADGSIYSNVTEIDGPPVFRGSVTVNANYPVIRLSQDRTALVITSNGIDNGGLGSAYIADAVSGVQFQNFQASLEFDPSANCVLDSYTVYAGASSTYGSFSDKMYSSVPLDPANVPVNSFATAEARADSILDLVVLGRTFWVFGSLSVEMWYNQGGSSDFAFVPFTNSLLEVGLASRLTLASLHGKVLWMGTDCRIWLGQGQSAQPISPGWVDLLLQQEKTPPVPPPFSNHLTAYMYSQGGDEFYVITKENTWSIELALSTMTWCYRQTLGRADSAVRCAMEYTGGETYVGLVTGEVCKVDLSSADEPGGRLHRIVTTMWLGDQESRNVVNQVDVTSYMGPSAGSFTLEWSDDRLETFKGLRDITWPHPGTRRAVARALGTARRRQLVLTYTGDKTPFEVDEFFVNISPGT